MTIAKAVVGGLTAFLGLLVAREVVLDPGRSGEMDNPFPGSPYYGGK